jgi:PAS domain S-box-containing protein
MTDYLRIQHDVVAVLSSTNDLSESLDMLLDHLLQLDIVDSGAIHFVEGDTGDLDFAAAKGFTPEFEKYLRNVKKPNPIMKSVMAGKNSVTKGPAIQSSGSCEMCPSENLGTILFFPIKHNGELIAVMSICSHSTEDIPEDVVTVVETIIAHVESVIVRTRVEAKLNDLIDFGKLQSEISTHFIGMEPENIDESINYALKKIGEFTGVNKIGAIRFSDDYMHVNGINAWCRDGTESEFEHFAQFYIGKNSWWIDQLFKGEPFCINSMEDLPLEAVTEREVLLGACKESLLVIPMTYRGKILGNLCLTYSSEKKWPKEYLLILRLLGEVFANAHQHKCRESKIKESENKYRRIFEEIHDVYFETKIDGTILTLSPSIGSFLGYKPEELIGSSMFGVDTKRLRYLYEEWDKSGCLNDAILQMKKKDGTLITTSINAHITCGINGESERIAGIARNVTELKNIEKMLIEAKLLLENASRTKSEFLAIVNHELRTPLCHVLGFSEVLLEESTDPLTEKQTRCVESIHVAGLKLLELVTSLNSIAEIEEGKMELEITEFSVLPLISEVQRITSSMASKKNIALQFNIDFNIGGVNADRCKLKTILLNLINNAIKFTPESGKVTVEVMQDMNQVLHISVNDTGIGISEEDQQIIFKPFVQLESSLNRKYEGAGLGLALVKEFAEIQGGTLSLKSELDRGSTFVVTIPG